MTETEVVDVSEHFPDAIKAERQGANVLVMYRLEEPRKIGGSKWANYRLHYRWLRNEAADIVEVLGSENSLWCEDEWNKDVSLFEQFRLFS